MRVKYHFNLSFVKKNIYLTVINQKGKYEYHRIFIRINMKSLTSQEYICNSIYLQGAVRNYP